MNIIFLINSLSGGGAERVVQTLSHNLVEKGDKVTIVSLEKSDRNYYSFDSNIELQNLKFSFFNKGFLKILTLPLQALEYRILLAKKKPDAGISFLVRANLVNIISRWLKNPIPIIISERSVSQNQYSVPSPKNKIMKTLINFLYPFSDGVIAVSNGVKESLISLGVASDKIKVIYNPQNVELIKENSKRESPLDFSTYDETIVTMGRLIELKEQENILYALKEVNKNRNVTLLIIGEGPEIEKLKKIAKNLKIIDKVKFLGWMKNPFSILKRSDIFILTSRHEAFGNVIVEALACGLPVISTDCPSGPKEILGDNEYGILVPVGDSQTLAKEIRGLLEDDEKREKYKRKGIERAEDFKVNNIVPQYLSYIKSKNF